MNPGEILPCPVCGHQPKVMFDVNPGGTFVKILCKPLFGAKHMEVEHGAASDDWAFEKAATDWNTRVECAKLALRSQLRICDKTLNRHTAIVDCRNYLKTHGMWLTSKQDDAMCQTIYWLYDTTSEAEVHYDKEGK